MVVLILLGFVEYGLGGFGHGEGGANGPDAEVAERQASGLTMQRYQCFPEFEQRAPRQREFVFIWLVHRANWVVEVGGARFLDVIAENVSDDLAFSKLNHALGALLKVSEIVDVEPAGVKAIAGEQDRSLAIVESNAHDVMSRDRNHVNNTVTEVDLADLVGPVGNLVEALSGFHFRGNEGHRDRGVVHCLDVRVSSDVIGMGMRMYDDQRDGFPLGALQATADYQRGQYDLARQGFLEYLETYPKTDLSDDAAYWIGECYAAQKKPREAIGAFDRLFRLYPQSDKSAAAHMKKGLAHLELGEKAQAIVELPDGSVRFSSDA